MIYRDSTVAMSKGTSTIDSPIILYRGDREVEINFTIQDSPFRYRTGSATNLIEKTEADYGQLIIKTPNNRKPIFSKITATDEGKIILKITADMIDEIEEVGKYDFQIRLFDSEQVSKVTIPPVEGGIEIREPIAIEDEAPISDTNEVNVAKVNYAVITTSEVLEPFDSQGNYIKTVWVTGDTITKEKLNKLEEGVYKNSTTKFDDIELSGNELNMKVNGTVKKTVSLPSTGGTVEGHTHENKTTLDKITEDKINSWDNKVDSIPADYVTETELNSKGYITEHQDISGKVDKVQGKGLSTNDLTNALKTNYDSAYTHSQSTHAPSNAQKNSDITKEEIEAKLIGEISSHSHASGEKEWILIDDIQFEEPVASYTKTFDKEYDEIEIILVNNGSDSISDGWSGLSLNPSDGSLNIRTGSISSAKCLTINVNRFGKHYKYYVASDVMTSTVAGSSIRTFIGLGDTESKIKGLTFGTASLLKATNRLIIAGR